MQGSAVEQVIAGLKAAGVSVVCYLPDSLLKELYPALDHDPDIRTIRVTNEGEGAAICGGIWLSGKKSALIMENSGLRASIEPLARMGMGAGIPVVMIMSHRGDLGENNWWAIPHGMTMEPLLGLAVGLPHRRIVSLDTDGGLLFNLGILATLANEQPKNLFIVIWDNECYESIGGPPTHTTSGRVDLAAIARGAGIEHAYAVKTLDEFDRHCEMGLPAQSPYVVVAKIDRSVKRDIKRKHSDGREDKYIFVRHVEQIENIVIMGPSEHN